MINGVRVNDADVDTFVAGDEEAYQLWLRNPSAAVGHIIHISYNGTSAVYPNWVNYTMKLSDFPVAGYHEVIRSIPNFTRQISDNLSGPVLASIGELVFENPDGAIDDWLKLAWDGQPVRVFQGDPSWPAERFRLLIECVAEGATGATLDAITLRLRGYEHGANTPIQTTLIPAAVGATAPSNQVMPKAFGPVFNVTPATIDEANQVYQWTDRGIGAVSAVRDGGVSFSTAQIAISAVNTGTDTLSTATEHGFYQNTRVRCDIGSLPTASQWTSIAWNGALFVAVAFGTAIAATSPDGIVWTERTMPSVADWRTVAWNGSVFCVAAYQSTKAATSPDGITWTARTLPSFGGWISIAWNGTLFFLLGANSTTSLTSPDGITWTARTLPSNAAWHGVAWSGTTFCAVSLASDAAATSPDGITWTAQTLPSSGNWRGLAWGNGLFCAAANGSTSAATSPDGITWTARTLPSAASWYGMAWSGSVFCLVSIAGTSAATSPDGITWTARTLPASSNWFTICWNGLVFCTLGATSAYATTSADGAAWSGVSNSLPAPLAVNTDYWVSADGLTSSDFKLSATRGGTTVLDITTATTGAVIIGYHWTAQSQRRQVILDSRPAAGYVTLDAIATSGTADTIIPEVLGAINIDAESKRKFALTCPQTVGIYIGERRNRLDVANDIMSGLGAWYGYNRYSLLKFGRVEASYAFHDFEIIEDQMDDGSFAIERMIPPAKMHRMSYRKNWTDQAGTLFAGVSTEAAGLYSTNYSVSPPTLGADEGSAGQEFHLLAVKPDVIETMMTYAADAQAEGVRRDGMFYGWGAIFRCTVGLVGSEMDPGHVVKVTHRRYGLSTGVRMALVYVEDRPTECRTVLKFFSALSAYVPAQL